LRPEFRRFSHNKEKTMHLQIDRRPPPIEDVVRRMKARIEREGWRPTIDTITAPHAASAESRERSERSRRHCHLPAEPKKLRYPSPRDTGAYVPEMAARVDNDLNLTDGARRCARKLAEYIYRKNRDGRESEITVTYLTKTLGRCRRTVQRYLRQLEREGYIEVWVVPSERTRMCFGLLVRLLDPLLPRHRRCKWPEKAGKPDATQESQIDRQRFINSHKRTPIPRGRWAFLCCEAVWRSYMKTLSPPPPFPVTV
jgi:hypothetical protein